MIQNIDARHRFFITVEAERVTLETDITNNKKGKMD